MIGVCIFVDLTCGRRGYAIGPTDPFRELQTRRSDVVKDTTRTISTLLFVRGYGVDVMVLMVWW